MKKRLLMEERQRQTSGSRKRFIGGLLVLVLIVILAGGGLWYRANGQARLDRTLAKGLELRESGQYGQAVALFLNLYEKHPGYQEAPEALYQAAEIQEIYLRRPAEALLTYLLLERDYPEAQQVAAAQERVAVLYKYRLNDCGQAIAAYQKVLDRSGPENDRLQYEMADCYFRLNNFEQSRIEFENLLNNYPLSDRIAEVQYRIAVTYALEGKRPEAAAAYRRVAEDWPDSPYALEARFGLATVLEEQEELREALQILEDLDGIYPKTDILKKKTDQVRERIDKKKKAI
ncbi:MAG: tetratricopeptide repeat protein [Desulfuromonadales bacterium]